LATTQQAGFDHDLGGVSSTSSDLIKIKLKNVLRIDPGLIPNIPAPICRNLLEVAVITRITLTNC
jgi:hypothetical protein